MLWIAEKKGDGAAAAARGEGGGDVLRRRAMMVRVGEVCPWGALCKFGLSGTCKGQHTVVEIEHFAQKREIRQREARSSCP